MFRRRRGADDEPEPDGGEEVMESAVDDEPTALSQRPNGPFDITEVFENVEVVRLDFGSLLVPAADGMQIQLEVDQDAGIISTVNVIAGDSVLALSVFAAPRGEGLWADVISDLRGSIADGGGLLDTVAGEYGPELRAQVPTPDNPGLTPVRFVGVDGPRWFLRGVFTGAAAHGGSHADTLDAVMRSTVVTRGTEPMAPGDLLPLSVPAQLPPSVDATGPDAPSG